VITASITEALLAARRNLDDIHSVKILDDWRWEEKLKKWVLHTQINIESTTEDMIPRTTEWYVLVSSEFPLGDIILFPSKKNGLTQTFQHQSFNGIGHPSYPWRNGNLCLSTGLKSLGLHSHDLEPSNNWRLHWHFKRAIEWLKAASKGTLASLGDPFELPAFPLNRTTRKVVFTEGTKSFTEWQQISIMAGIVELTPLGSDRKVLAVTSFQSTRYHELLHPHWGKVITDLSSKTIEGVWIRLKQLPVLEPWQIPLTWDELRDACRIQQIDLDRQLMEIFPSIRDGKRHLLLLGFPLPSEIGGSMVQIHWQAIELPTLSYGQTTAKGFRTNEKGYWRRDRLELIDKDTHLVWAETENWHSAQILTRGRLPESITDARILVIGAGAIGSVVSELLVRGNAQKLALLDSDKLEVGNLSRHNLELDSIGKNKAEEIARHLNITSPHAKVESINCQFPLMNEEQVSYIQKFELILDCTGADSVIDYLEEFIWEDKKLFMSISLGMGAKRLFCFVAHGKKFPGLIFKEKILPWMKKERQEYKDVSLPWSGIGCWHPVFPARVDDVWMLASVAVKHLESVLKSPPEESLVVFEQIYDENNSFCGVRQVNCNENQNQP
jgi:hypothetical protein